MATHNIDIKALAVVVHYGDGTTWSTDRFKQCKNFEELEWVIEEMNKTGMITVETMADLRDDLRDQIGGLGSRRADGSVVRSDDISLAHKEGG